MNEKFNVVTKDEREGYLPVLTDYTDFKTAYELLLYVRAQGADAHLVYEGTLL